MKVISKLYVSDADLTSVVIPYVENQEMLKDIVDSSGKLYEVVGIGMNQRLEINGLTDLHVKGNLQDDRIKKLEYKQ